MMISLKFLIGVSGSILMSWHYRRFVIRKENQCEVREGVFS